MNDTAMLPLDLPKLARWQKAKAYAVDSVRRFRRQWEEHGGVVRKSDVGRVLKISPSRVGELVAEGKLRQVELKDADGEVLVVGISLRSLAEHVKSRGPGGRPRKTPLKS